MYDNLIGEVNYAMTEFALDRSERWISRAKESQDYSNSLLMLKSKIKHLNIPKEKKQDIFLALDDFVSEATDIAHQTYQNGLRDATTVINTLDEYFKR